MVDKLQRVQNSDIFTGCLSKPEFPILLHVAVSTPSPPPPLLISLTFYICTLLLDLFAPVPTSASSKFHSISARQKVIVLSLTLVLLSGTHGHCTLEILPLLTPSSLLQKPISSTSKNLISSYLPVLLCVSVCAVCGACVCVDEREREREKERERERECVQQM